MSGSHAFTRFARRLKANGLSPFHNSTVIGIYPQEVAPTGPQLLVLEPQIVRTRDRPAGSQNCPPQTTQNNSTRREPSGFEYEATGEARDRDRNREQGQGGRRGQAGRGRDGCGPAW